MNLEAVYTYNTYKLSPLLVVTKARPFILTPAPVESVYVPARHVVQEELPDGV